MLTPGSIKINVYGKGANANAADTANVVRLFDATNDRKPDVNLGESGVDERYAAVAREVALMRAKG